MWRAGVNDALLGVDKTAIKKMLGWKKNPHAKPLPVKHSKVSIDTLPASFDAAQQWPACSTIATIYDQARCGSCWAFGAVEPISDRTCIATNGSFNQVLSFQDLVACGPDDGCEGGDAGDAWDWVHDKGLVTASCSPYTVPTCPPSQEPCLNFVDTPACVQHCTGNTSINWSNDKHYTKATYSLDSVTDMMNDVMTQGPIEVCFTVYEDMLSYKSGVYKHTSGEALGGHCVKLRGWGVMNNTPYWIINNSWTTSWGNQGMIYILRGNDECGIEDDAIAGHVSA